MKTAMCTLMLFLTLFFSKAIIASCTFVNGDPIISSSIEINAPQDVYIGTNFITEKVWGDSSEISQTVSVFDIDAITCSSPWQIQVTPSTFASTGNEGYMDTNVKSVRLSTGVTVTGEYYDFSTNSQFIEPGFQVKVSSVRFNMIKSSATSRGDGVIGAGDIARVNLIEGGNTYELAVIRITPIIVHAGTCSVSTASQDVELGTYSRQEFSGVGHKTQAVSFSIAFSCDPNIQIYGQFDGVDTTPLVKGVFALNNETESATGIGVLLKNVSGDTDGVVMENGVRAVWFKNTPEDGRTINVSFTAQYYQLNDSVTSGDANASVTYTVAYD